MQMICILSVPIVAALAWAVVATFRSIRADRKRVEAMSHDERREDWIDNQ